MSNLLSLRTILFVCFTVVSAIPVFLLAEEQANNSLLLASLFAVFGSWWLARFISGPFADIADYSESIAAGSLRKYTSKKKSFIPTEVARQLVSFKAIVDSLSAKCLDLEETSRKLSEAQKIAKLGNWEIRDDAEAMWCSDEVYSILNMSKTSGETCRISVVQGNVQRA